VREPLAYVHDRVAPIRGRQKIPELSRASLRFSVVVCVRTSAFLGMASFRGQGFPGGAPLRLRLRGPSATAEGRRGCTRAQPVTISPKDNACLGLPVHMRTGIAPRARSAFTLHHPGNESRRLA